MPRTILTVVLALLVVSCSGESSSSTTTTGVTTSEQTTTTSTSRPNTTSTTLHPEFDVENSSYGRLLDAGRAGAVPDTTLALTEFALQFGPVPGALDLNQDGSQPPSATGALESVFSVWDELDAAQRSAVVERLRPWFAELEASTSSVRFVSYAPPKATFQLTLPALNDIAAAAESEITSHLGGDLDYSILVLPEDPETGDLATSPTGPFLAGRADLALIAEHYGIEYSPTISTCTIVMGPTATALVQPEINSALAHELFHCWSQTTSPDLAAHVATPDWYQEGMASWVGETFAGGSRYSVNWWRFYLSPRIFQLYASEYPAIGFWSWLSSEGGVDLWSAIPDLHRIAITGNDTSLFLAATQGIDPERLTGLGASRFRDPGRGPRWDMGGPGVRGGHSSDPLPLPVGETRGVEAAAGTLNAVTFTRPTPASEQVIGVTISGTGTWRARWADGTEIVGEGSPTDERWCLTEPCECPDGTSILGYDPLPAGADVLDVAATGGADTTSLAEVIVEDLCSGTDPEPDDPREASSLTGNWRARDAAVNRMFATLFDQTEGASLGGNVTGDVWLNLDGSGGASLNYVNVVVPIAAEGIEFQMTVNGGGDLAYTVSSDTIDFSGQTLDITFTAFGEPITIGDGDIALGAPATVVWGLEGDQLILQPVTSDTPIPNQWERRS